MVRMSKGATRRITKDVQPGSGQDRAGLLHQSLSFSNLSPLPTPPSQSLDASYSRSPKTLGWSSESVPPLTADDADGLQNRLSTITSEDSGMQDPLQASLELGVQCGKDGGIYTGSSGQRGGVGMLGRRMTLRRAIRGPWRVVGGSGRIGGIYGRRADVVEGGRVAGRLLGSHGHRRKTTLREPFENGTGLVE